MINNSKREIFSKGGLIDEDPNIFLGLELT